MDIRRIGCYIRNRVVPLTTDETHRQLLWDKIFNALIQHQNLLIKRHQRSQILSFQIDTLSAAIRVLLDAMKVCNTIKHLKPHAGTYLPSVEWTTSSLCANRKLWDELFDALNEHHDSLRKPHEQQNVLREQIDTLKSVNAILSGTLDACIDEEERPAD